MLFRSLAERALAMCGGEASRGTKVMRNGAKNGTMHHVASKNGKAKPYQVKQAIAAIDRSKEKWMSIRKAAAMPPPVAQYCYSVQWSPEDQEFGATILEFPSLSRLDEHQFEALRGIERLVSDVIDELTRSGESSRTTRASPEASY